MLERGFYAINSMCNKANENHRKSEHVHKGKSTNKEWVGAVISISNNGNSGYLYVVMDLHSREILSYKFSEYWEAGFAIAALMAVFKENAVSKPSAFHWCGAKWGSWSDIDKYLIKNGIETLCSVKAEHAIGALKYALKHELQSQADVHDIIALAVKVDNYIQYHNKVRKHELKQYT